MKMLFTKTFPNCVFVYQESTGEVGDKGDKEGEGDDSQAVDELDLSLPMKKKKKKRKVQI